MLAQRLVLTMRPSSGQSPVGSTATHQLGPLPTEAIDHKPLQRLVMLIVVYFDQLLGAVCTRKLVVGRFQPVADF